MTLLGMAMKSAAAMYFKWGMVTTPQGLDSNGFPKRPLTKGWPETPLDWPTIASQPWAEAKGIGIVLGPRSAGVCILDIDDVELATAAFEICAAKTRCVRTIRKRAHLYLVEESASSSTSLTVEWRGRSIKVDLQTTGRQCAAPPTPGYEHIGDRDQKPMTVPSIRYAWDALAARLGIATPAGGTPQNAGYPRPWQPQVLDGDRNKALYIEAHRLREAKMPLDQALAILQVRWEQDYQQGGQSWYEVERTVRSAYRKGQRVRPAPRGINLEGLDDHATGEAYGG